MKLEHPIAAIFICILVCLLCWPLVIPACILTVLVLIVMGILKLAGAVFGGKS